MKGECGFPDFFFLFGFVCSLWSSEEFVFEMKELWSPVGTIWWHRLLSKFVCYYKHVGFFFFKKFHMNESEEAKRVEDYSNFVMAAG